LDVASAHPAFSAGAGVLGARCYSEAVYGMTKQVSAGTGSAKVFRAEIAFPPELLIRTGSYKLGPELRRHTFVDASQVASNVKLVKIIRPKSEDKTYEFG